MKNKLLRLAKLLPSHTDRIIALAQEKAKFDFTPVEGQIVETLHRYYGNSKNLDILFKNKKYIVNSDYCFVVNAYSDPVNYIITPRFTPGIDSENEFPHDIKHVYPLYKFVFIDEMKDESDENECVEAIKICVYNKDVNNNSSFLYSSSGSRKISEFILYSFLNKYPEFFQVITNILNKEIRNNKLPYDIESSVSNLYKYFMIFFDNIYKEIGIKSNPSFLKEVLKIPINLNLSEFHSFKELEAIPPELLISVEEEIQKIFESNPLQYFKYKLYEKYSQYLKVGHIDDILVIKSYAAKKPLLFIKDFKNKVFDYHDEIKIESRNILSETGRNLYKNVPKYLSAEDFEAIEEFPEYKNFVTENYPERIIDFFMTENIEEKEHLIYDTLIKFVTKYKGSISYHIIKFKNIIKNTYELVIDTYLKYNEQESYLKESTLKSLISYENNQSILSFLYNRFFELFDKTSISYIILKKMKEGKITAADVDALYSILEDNKNTKIYYLTNFFKEGSDLIRNNQELFKNIIESISKMEYIFKFDQPGIYNTISNALKEAGNQSLIELFERTCGHLFQDRGNHDNKTNQTS